MALTVKLAENAAATHEDKLTIKAISETPIVARSPIVIPLPGGTTYTLDMGRRQTRIDIVGIADESVTELYYNGIAGGTFTVGYYIGGNAAWNATVTPARAARPYCQITATTATSLFVKDLDGSEFFVNDESITEYSDAGGVTPTLVTAVVNEPFASKQRWEMIAQYFYANGAMTLTSNSGSYSVQIRDMNFSTEAGKEDRYEMKISFVKID